MSPAIQQIPSRIHDYELRYETEFSFLKQLVQFESAFFVIDSTVFNLYKDHFLFIEAKENVFYIEAREENKTLQYAEEIIDKLITLQPNKKTALISIGGGITQDLTGFVASTFYRGIQWIYMPTTLLAQADSCMGSKTSLNYKSFKNILGTFYPPHQIVLCTQFIETLTDEDYYSGMGEVLKLHAMGGMDSLDNLIQDLPEIHQRNLFILQLLIKESLRIKWTYMENDEFDTGKRNLLNYGHCFGHAIETATNYSIPHGQAVIIGMLLANYGATQKGVLTKPVFEKTTRVFFDLLHTNYKQLRLIDKDVLLNAMKQDKKRIGKHLPLILMNDSFEFTKILDFTEEEAGQAIEWFINSYC